MFRPTTVTSHKVRLQYSEESREKKTEHHLRTNHGSFPSFRNGYDDLAAAMIGETAASKATLDEKISKIHELPSVENPPSLPGDCNVKEFVLEKLLINWKSIIHAEMINYDWVQ